jgi:hypothetical protein
VFFDWRKCYGGSWTQTASGTVAAGDIDCAVEDLPNPGIQKKPGRKSSWLLYRKRKKQRESSITILT